jgi:hypothetical protein
MDPQENGGLMISIPDKLRLSGAPGHIQGWDGTHWVSDFKQRPDNIYPGPKYRVNKTPHIIYRPPDCPPVSAPEQTLWERIKNWVSSFWN